MTSLLHPKTYARLLGSQQAQQVKKQLGGCSSAGQHAAQAATAQQGCASTKGLLNGPGQNNCFLNSAVQVLWHLDIFRRSFRELSGHACMAESCIFCALKELFGQLQFSQESALPPDALRRALAESFFDQQRFQLGFMDDAAECFENILLRVHYHIASSEQEDMCNARHCIPHQKFAMTLVEQSVCEACHVTSEPLSYTQMVHYVSASALTTQARQLPKSSQPDMFGQLLRKAGGMGDIRDCPSSCGAKIQICRALMNRPEIVSVGVVWDSERPTLDHIMAVFATIGTSLRLSDVFHSVMDHRWAATTTHSLVGVVTYYGKHYSTFFFHTKLRVWIYFDDATVREIGPRFEQVVEKCRRGRYQPLLLLYAVQGGSPVSTESAPKTIVQVKPDSIKPCRSLGSAKSQLPSQIPLRRSVTPSPEKTQSSMSPRRAITPNPDHRGGMQDNQRAVPNNRDRSMLPPMSPTSKPKCYADYQNLADMQAVIFQGQELNGEPGYISRQAVESVMSYQKQNPLQRTNSVYESKKPAIQRTNSSVSSDGGLAVPDHLNVPRRRDSGNWSGDRNSASSSSSLENPYLYLVGKLQSRVPRSPTSTKPPGDFLDPGYDSYSLSSNDSLPLQQGLKLNLQLAQIPENHPSTSRQAPATSDECERLCLEADRLLEKSRQLEEASDLETALVLSSAAAGKSRAAMDAPYNNPQTLTFARMKHNACVMRVRSLHRRLAVMQDDFMGKEDCALDIRHSRENSGSSNRSGSHSRQGSRDKTVQQASRDKSAQHSRQSSRELVNMPPPVVQQEKPSKTIEIYATLPKKKIGGSLRSKTPVKTSAVEDAEYMYDRPGRSLYSRAAKKDAKVEEKNTKRARSEERNKNTRDYSLLSTSSTLPKESPKKEKEKEKEKVKEEKKKEKTDKQAGGKKQHKIRRKLLMGGLIRRKNRSMPDLREGQDAPVDPVELLKSSQDDSTVGLKNEKNLSGYLSEGHLEYSGSNPGMERSRLMRKTSHGSAGKGLLPPKVPPLPPLRTTSQLTAKDGHVDRPQYPLPESDSLNSSYQSSYSYDSSYLPYKEPVTYANGGILLRGFEEDVGGSAQNLALPPYPSPLNSVNHSRQPSEEFPPPPPPLEDTALLPPPAPTPQLEPAPNSLLAQLQLKRQQILEKESATKTPTESEPPPKTSEQWLKELQAKQAERKAKKQHTMTPSPSFTTQQESSVVDNSATVRDLASRFESVRMKEIVPPPQSVDVVEAKPGIVNYSYEYMASMQSKSDYLNNMQSKQEYVTGRAETVQNHQSMPEYVTNLQPKHEYPMNMQTRPEYLSNVQPKQEYVSNLQNKPDFVSTLRPDEIDVTDGRRRSGKKKNVTFCDEVILVATAEDEEEDSFIPNPILQRVLRSAFKFDGSSHAKQEVRVSQIALKSDDQDVRKEPPLTKAEADAKYYEKPPVYKPAENRPYQEPSRPYSQTEAIRLQSTQRPISYQQNPSMPSNHVQQNGHAQQVYQQTGSPLMNHHQNGSPLMNHHQNSSILANHQQNTASLANHPQNVATLANNQQSMSSLQNHQQISSSMANHQQNTTSLANHPQNVSSLANHQQNVATLANHQQNSSSMANLQQNGTSIPSHLQNGSSLANHHQNASPIMNHQPVYQQNPNQPSYQHLPQPTYNQQLSTSQQRPMTVNPHAQQSAPHPQAVGPYQHVPSNPHQPTGVYQQVPSGSQQPPNPYQQQPQQNQSSYQQVPTNPQHQMNSNSSVYQQPPTNPHQTLGTYQQIPSNPHQTQNNSHQNPSPYQQVPSNGHPPQNTTSYQQLPQSHPHQTQSPYQQIPTTTQHPQQPTGNLQYPTTPHQVHKQYHQQATNPQQPYQYLPSNAYYHQLPGKQAQQPVYQRVPSGQEFPPYQHPPPPRQPNSSREEPSAVTKAGPCHLCRKKPVASPAIYCTDCHFYMSRFKPRT